MTDQTIDLSSVLTAVEDAGLFERSTCTIQAPSMALNGIGQPDLITYSDVPELTGIPCMISVLNIGEPASEETKAADYTREQLERHCLLDGNFQGILQRHRAVVNSIAYDILSVQEDSQGIMTRMHLRRVDF